MAPRAATKHKAGAAGDTQMGSAEGDPQKKLSEAPGVLEEGKIFFFYRPRPGRRDLDDPDAIQRFYIVMLPVSRHAPVRLMSVASAKRLPDRGERFWGTVLETAATMDDVLKELGPKQNPNLRHRLLPAAKVVGEGIYVLYDDGRNVRLLYELEVPMYPQEAQEELGVYKTGDYAIQVRNPWKDHPRTVNPPQRAAYPSDYQKLFQGPNAPKSAYMWIPPREPSLLDYKNAVFTLIGRSPNWHHQFKNLPQSLAELLDQAVKEDLGPEAYGEGTDDDAAMIDKLRSDVAADRYGIDISPVLGGDDME